MWALETDSAFAGEQWVCKGCGASPGRDLQFFAFMAAGVLVAIGGWWYVLG